MTGTIRPNDRVLLIGDSVTDCDRARSSALDGSADLGKGYPFFISAWWNALHPEYHNVFLNRGISGNRVRDLRALGNRLSGPQAQYRFDPDRHQRYLAAL